MKWKKWIALALTLCTLSSAPAFAQDSEGGWQKVGDKLVYYTAGGARLSNCWIGAGEWKYYVGADGRALEGLQEVEGKTYYFKAFPWCNVQYGWQTIDGGLYYFGEDGAMVCNRWIGGGEWKYYVGADGRALEGLHTVEGHTYYFREFPWCNMQYGTQNVGGQTLTFDLVTGELASDLNTDPKVQLTVTMGGQLVTGASRDILARVVMAEAGGFQQIEVLKAQAVATYTWILYQRDHGDPAPSVPAPLSSPTALVYQAVDAVLGETVTYAGKPILAQYTASTGKGMTNSSQDAGWGYLPYLQPVASPYDERSEGMLGGRYTVQKTVTKQQMMNALNAIYDNDPENPEPIDFSSDPAGWISYDTNAKGCAGVLHIDIRRLGAGESRMYNPRANYFKENSGLGIRSADYVIQYNGDETWTITTYGFGHGVGLSQWGAYFYATIENMSYRQILAHYYPGTQIQ